jgi:hypothetical protein
MSCGASTEEVSTVVECLLEPCRSTSPAAASCVGCLQAFGGGGGRREVRGDEFQGGADFADLLTGRLHRAEDCAETVPFDRPAANRSRWRLLSTQRRGEASPVAPVAAVPPATALGNDRFRK